MKQIIFALSLILGLSCAVFSLSSCKSRREKGKKEAKEAKAASFQLNIYLENSGSLWGYVNGERSEYRNFVQDVVQTAQTKGLLSGVQLNFISTEVTPVTNEDVEGRLKQLSKADYSATTSDMIDMLGMIADAQQPGEVSMFVSDCIFTSSNQNMSTENLATGIKGKMLKLLEKGDNSVLVYALPCSFKGQYYAPKQGGMPFEGERPLYVWLMGDTKALARMVHEMNFEHLEGVNTGYHEFAAIKTKTALDFVVAKKIKGAGTYRLVRGDKHAIEEAETASGRKSGFSVTGWVKLGQLPLSDTYLADVRHYTCSHPAFEVSKVQPARDEEHKGAYEVTLQLKNPNSPAVPKGKITVTLERNPCSWLEEVSDSEGGAPIDGRTFGVQHMLNGLMHAYENAGEVGQFTLDIQ